MVLTIILKLDKVGYKVGTIIIKYIPISYNVGWNYVFDIQQSPRCYLAYVNKTITTTMTYKDIGDYKYLTPKINNDITTANTSLYIGCSSIIRECMFYGAI